MRRLPMSLMVNMIGESIVNKTGTYQFDPLGVSI